MADTASNIVRVLARVYVDDLDDALPLYADLAGEPAVRRFSFDGMRLAGVGPFLLIEGAAEDVRDRAATLAVRDLDAVQAAIANAGGVLLSPPAAGPNGARLVARHPDGTVIEYIEVAGG
jgi:predicted enzyme related to lactoylglutathione lyase